MTGDLTDEDILAALDRAVEEERTLLVLALGESSGEQGPPFLRRLVRDPAPDEAGLSAVGLTPLAERCGSEVTPDLLERFTANRRRVDTQRWLLHLIARYADDRAGDAVLDWLERRLRGQQRGRYGDPNDLPLAITFLAQHPRCAPLLKVAGQSLVGMWPKLVKDERRWLARHWSGLAPTSDGARSEVAPPSEVEVERMREWLAGTSFFQSRALPEHVEPILERLNPSRP